MFRFACMAGIWLVAAAAWAQPLEQVKVINDRAPDCSTLAAIVESVTRGCRTDDERAIAIFNFCRYDHYHCAYPSEPGGVSALKFINVYGWGLCGGQHTVLAALWEAAGFQWRYRGWSDPGHTTVEAFYGGRWHYLDTFLDFYTWVPDPQAPGGRTIASQEDIRATPALIEDAFVMDAARKVCYHADNRFDYFGDKANWTAPAFLVCGDELPGVLRGVRSSNNAGSPRGWGGIVFETPDYSTDVNLRPGSALTLQWSKTDGQFYFAGSDRPPQHSCGDKDYRNCPAIGPLLEPYRGLAPARSWSNGMLEFRPDLSAASALDSFHAAQNVTWRAGELVPADAAQPATVVIEMASPYVVAKASGLVQGGVARAEVSPDEKQWTSIDLADFTAAVRGRYRYFLRLTLREPLRAVEVTSVVQHNQESLPYLAPGVNRMTISAANPERLGNNRLVVTYAYCLGSRDRTPEQMLDADAEIARAHYATWSEQPIVVQQTFTRLPATFEIPVPTPNGRQPVYPRMVFLRRELLAPGQPPLPVPVPPTAPRVGEGEYLATVPSPWRIGAEKPQPVAARKVTTTLHVPQRLSYVSKGGEVIEHEAIRWLKDDSDAKILLADFGLTDLPATKSLAAAKLIFYVHEAHDRAPMQAAAVQLTAPFAGGAAYDFAKLGRVVGTTIVAQGQGPDAPFTPPRRYEIDVTRLVRAWSNGEPQHGVALRIVPNRSVDDGWSVRFTPVREKPIELEITRYADEAAATR